MEISKCVICNKNSFIKFKFGLIQCLSCKHIISPRIWEANINELMEDSWFDEVYIEKKRSFWVDWFERINNRRTLSRIKSNSSFSKRLLDVGIGSGSFLCDARENGFTVMGCDLSKSISIQVSNRFGVPVYCGSLGTLVTDEGFHCIVMNHVLEHVQDPINFLQEVYRLLEPGGIVHISCPNISCWESRFQGWTSYEPYHLSYFSKLTLELALENTGFKVIRSITHEPFSGWFLTLLRAFLRVNKNGGAIDRSNKLTSNIKSVQKLSPLIEHTYRISMLLFGVIIWPFRKIQQAFHSGEELICIAKK